MISETRTTIRRPHIVVVDDDQGILEALGIFLREEGYKVTASEYVGSLFKGDNALRPDVIILDVLLSGSDGRDVCRMLKAREDTKHIPVILISAAPHVEQSARESGADAFLSKPFDMEYFLTLIAQFVKH